MNSELIFQIGSNAALVGWLLLIFLPKKKWVQVFVPSIVVTLLCIIYAYLFLTGFSLADLGKFGTLIGVVELFRSPQLVLVGWIHYLAFDLLIGVYINSNASKYSINHWLCVPCLLLTFMAGPIGLLLYFLIRSIKTRKVLVALN